MVSHFAISPSHPCTQLPPIKVDAGDFFYYQRDGIYDAMPACWKNLDEAQRREVAALIKSFYDESAADSSKDPWSVANVKRCLNLGFVKLDEVFKFRAAYLASVGDESIFITPVDDLSPDSNAVAEDNSPLLDTHDGFALAPKELMTEYKEKRNEPEVQGKLFVHMTNFVATQHVTENKGKEDMVQLEPTRGLDVEMTKFQKKLLNPTTKDVMMSELIDQAQGKRAKKKEAKRRQDVINGNIGSYSAILNSEEKLEAVKDYNALAASLGMLNAEKDEKAKAAAQKKKDDAAAAAQKKAENQAKEAAKRNELLPGFIEELEQKTLDGILALPDTRMRLYIRYFFDKYVVNLSKKKKPELKDILTPLLEKHYADAAEAAAGTTADPSGQIV